MLVQQFKVVIDDRIFGPGEEVRLREGGLRDRRTGILAVEFGDDVVEVLLRAQVLQFEHFHNGGNLPHVGDGGLFDGHALACGAWVAHRVTVSTSKVAYGCAITFCRTQVSTERGQGYLVKLVATCLCLNCDQAKYHVPYCPKNT